MKRLLIERMAAALLMAMAAVCVSAQNVERIPECEQNVYGARTHVNGDYDTMRHIREYWTRESSRLKTANKGLYEFALVGGYESILKVTIPIDEVFAAGDTLVSASADLVLFPLLRYLRDDGMASAIISCHSDNNGSATYLDGITTARAAAIGRWMEKQKVAAANIDCYGWADRSPRTDNDTMRHRARNRRVCIYLVPNRHMLRLAKRNKL